MVLRNVLIVLGVLSLVAGVTLSAIWLSRTTAPVAEAPAPEATRPAVLAASRAVRAGSLLRTEDIRWKEIGSGEIRPGMLLRGQVPEAEFLGAITRRDFAANEALIASDLVKPSERQFLAAVLRPNTRAVSIAVDTPQSASGLVMPGDHVDIILTQSFEDAVADPVRRSVSETVLRDVRVIAIDQSLRGTPARSSGLLPPDARSPKTVTFEVTERQAEVLFVAAQLGRLQLAVRPLEHAGQPAGTEGRASPPTWASDASPALRDLSRRQPQPERAPNPLESYVRRPPRVTQ